MGSEDQSNPRDDIAGADEARVGVDPREVQNTIDPVPNIVDNAWENTTERAQFSESVIAPAPVPVVTTGSTSKGDGKTSSVTGSSNGRTDNRHKRRGMRRG